MSDATKKLSEAEVAAMEQTFARGDLDQLDVYGFDACRYHSGDQTELNRRSKVLITSCDGLVTGVRCLAIMSALTDNMRAFRKCVEMLGDDLDPSLGFLAYRFIRTSDSVVSREMRLEVLAQSRRAGHLGGTAMYWHERLAPYGFTGRALAKLIGICVGIRAAYVTATNPDDPRLAGMESLGRSGPQL